jgi:hypothetical protein
MLKMIEGGPEITAVHNHLLRARLLRSHARWRYGDPTRMALVIREALTVGSKTSSRYLVQRHPAVDLDTGQLDQIIGVKGQANGGVYQFTVPRRDPVTENGMQISPVGPMGVAIAIGFQPTGGGKAAITGDFVLSSDEVNPVIRALRANDIDVTAVHSHMLDEQPRLSLLATTMR